MSKIHTNTEKFCSNICVYKERLLVPWMFICSHYRHLFYDAVVTVTLC